ncbi:MAG: alpha/beta hydrolase domain-containing protein [Myxococcota bacterium]
MVIRRNAARPQTMLYALAMCTALLGAPGCSDDGGGTGGDAGTGGSGGTAGAGGGGGGGQGGVGGDVPSGPPASVTVEGPIEGPGSPFVAGTRELDLADADYQETEFFVSGTARSYVTASPLTEDGLWNDIRTSDTAEYKTRILVYSPIDPQAFSGTVLVEWLNVSGGLDAAPDWNAIHTEVFREGHVWIGVSAQFVGVEGRPGDGLNLSLKVINGPRYESLTHPGDSFSYEMYAQIGEAIRNPTGVDPLSGLELERLIAMGESQSAGRLLTYVNALGDVYDLWDAYVIHSRVGGSAPLSQAPETEVPTPNIVRARDDLDQPILVFQTETDLITLGALPDRQDDSAMFRQWEVAGTAHNDTYTLVVSNSDLGDDPSVADVIEVVNPAPTFTCELPINSGPQHWVLKAGVAGLIDWITEGTPLPNSPRLMVNSAGDGYELDELGNALGGIRTPYVDAPVAVLSGLGQPGDSFCRIWGTTALFDQAQLGALYPTAEAYIDAVTATTESAVEAGFILPPDAALIVAAAEASGIGGN